MLGALLGLENIPEYMQRKLLLCDTTKDFKKGKNGIQRPDFLSQKGKLLQNINDLVEARPEKDIKLEIIRDHDNIEYKQKEKEGYDSQEERDEEKEEKAK
jgi:hypothetical protein